MRRLSITGQLVRYVSLVLLDIAARGNSKKRRLIVNLGVFNFEYTFFIVSSVLNVNDKVKPFGKMNKMDSFKAYMMPKKSGNKQKRAIFASY